MTIEELQAELTKVSTEKENYKKAVEEERARRKTAEAKLSSQETTSTDHITAVEKERDTLKKQVETLTNQVSEKDKAIEEATAKSTEFEQKALAHDAFVTKNLDDKLKLIPEDKKEFVQKALNGKSLDEQLELADEFASQYKDFKTTPTDKGENPNDTSEFQKAKEAGDIRGLIQNAPIIKD